MADAREPAVLASVTGQVGRIVLNRPKKHNAFDDDIIATLATHLSEFDRREDIREPQDVVIPRPKPASDGPVVR